MLSALFLCALPDDPTRSQVAYRRIPVKELASQKSICVTLVFRGQRASQHDNVNERMASNANSASSAKDALNCWIIPVRSTDYSRLLLFSKRLTRQSAPDDPAPRHRSLRQYEPISALQGLPANAAKEAQASVP